MIPLLLFSASSFVLFGYGCLTHPHFKLEFQRYGLAKYQTLIGILQLVGGVGIVVGFWSSSLQILSTGGLSLLMLMGFSVRLKIRDSIKKSFPAFFYCLLNGFLTYSLLLP